MHPDDSIEALEHLGFYRAPRDRRPNPVTIREGCEYIELITGGGVLHDDGGGEREYGCGSLFWHLPGEQTIHKSVLDAPYECLTVMFRVRPPFRRIAPRSTFWDPHEAKAFAEEVLRVYHGVGADKAVLCRYVHARLLWAASGASAFGGVSAALPPPLKRALSLIEAAFGTELDVASMAIEAKVSVPHLHSLFKRHLGKAPHQFLLDRRLQEARKLLGGSVLNLKSIAYECGFPSVEHFCRVFKSRFEITAAEFRRRQEPARVLAGRRTGFVEMRD
jgi:AraC-like DNA-binding protein